MADANKKGGREAAAAYTDDFLERIILRLARVVKKKYGRPTKNAVANAEDKEPV